MENFIVSARKYRPATFDLVVGQESITTTLKNAIKNNQLAQAFLFCGPRGVGKTTCARILAKTINCFHPKNQVEPCDECESCVSFNRSASFNIHELDAASNNSVDDIRNLVDQVRIHPQVGKYKVYIIDEVHMLSQAAFNAFLKTLEEPPSYAKFILATTEKHKIIPTILSRCQIFDFKRISVKDIASYLEFVAKNEGVVTSEEALHMIAQKADGALRDALSFFDQLVSFAGKELTYETVIEHLNILDYSYYFNIVDQVLNQDTAGTLMTINEINDRGFDGQHFIIGLGEHLRNLLVCKDAVTIKLLEVSPNIAIRYKEQAASCSQSFLLKALEINNHCDLNYKSSNNKRLLLELSLLQMCSIVSGQPESEEKKNVLIAPVKGNKEALKHRDIETEKKKDTETIKHRNIEIDNQKKEETIKHRSKEALKQEEEEAIIIEDRLIMQSEEESHENTNKINNIPVTSTRKSRTISIKPENHIDELNGSTLPPVIDPEKLEKREFTQDQLDKVWTYYTESIARQYPNYYSILSGRKPQINKDFVLDLTLDNKVQDMTIQQKKAEMLDFLRNELRNFKINLNVIISENEDSNRPYTGEEKYRAMLDKNPTLKELKDRLDLEVDL